MTEEPGSSTTSFKWMVWVGLLHSKVSQGIRDLVGLCRDAGRCDVEVDVVLLVQAQVAVAHEIQCVDIPNMQERNEMVKPLCSSRVCEVASVVSDSL